MNKCPSKSINCLFLSSQTGEGLTRLRVGLRDGERPGLALRLLPHCKDTESHQLFCTFTASVCSQSDSQYHRSSPGYGLAFDNHAVSFHQGGPDVKCDQRSREVRVEASAVPVTHASLSLEQFYRKAGKITLRDIKRLK